MATITLDNVSKHFPGKSGGVQALDTINLSVAKGEFVSLLGPSGCGKSTLLSIVAGLEAPTTGAVTVEGAALTGPNTRSGVVFQSDLLLEWRSALDNVLLQIEMRGESTTPHIDHARELLDRVGLGKFHDSLPSQLSGGMRQRVAICRALVHKPSILLMDEPFGALDAITREQMTLDLSRLAADEQITVIFVTHSIEEAVFLGDRVIVMSPRPGRIAADIAVPIPQPRKEWPRGESHFDPYVRKARAVLEDEGAFRLEGA
ncbi:ABC transporter ATP-binding protein [Pseudooceanicola sp. MF1-13]|uniref:ABC transporter ATP-binding protein n=1 Tax=Pseudooceanicola sp. MF1-13 TaxID=3379095 RepID=UPI0038919118